MPENTDFDSLKCNFENHSLTIEVPVNPKLEKLHQIPIEFLF
jgi:hypothetical protein